MRNITFEVVNPKDVSMYIGKKSSKYEWIYKKIIKHIENDKENWLKIGGFEDSNTVRNFRGVAKRRFSNYELEMRIKKYQDFDDVSFALFIRDRNS